MNGSEQDYRRFAGRSWLCAPIAAALAGCAPAPATPQIAPLLVLDIAEPVVEARIGSEVLRLRVDFDRRNTVELNPDAAERLGLPFEEGDGALVGRTEVAERNAPAIVTIGGIAVPLTVSAFDRACCTGADGAIGPDLLPYDTVRFVRRGAIAVADERRIPLDRSDDGGLAAAVPVGGDEIRVGFSLGYPGTLATAAAGAILAKGFGGRFVGDEIRVTPAFGVSRPARMLALDRPADLLGFRIAEVPVRIADFRGSYTLPQAAPAPGDLVVTRRGPRAQRARPSLLIGRDRLERCAEIVFRRAPMSIALHCARNAP